MPTLPEIAGTDRPGDQYQGRNVEPMKGTSMLPLLDGKSEQVHPDNYVMGWELFAKRALRQGDWKIILQGKPYGTDRWQLFNLKTDPWEQNDLVSQQPEKLNTGRIIVKGH